MFMRTAATFAAVVATSSILSTAALAQQDENAAHGQVDLGKTTFAQKCSHCHGPNMVNSGTVTPDLRRFPDDQPRFVTTVKQGKNGKMPPWADILSEQEIADVWAFLLSRRPQ